MKFNQKSKYFAYGVVATLASAPLIIHAVDSIPITFAEGDIISASVMNALLGRINDVQKGFVSAGELDGSWSCVTNDIVDYFDSSDCSKDRIHTKNSVIRFNSVSGTFETTLGNNIFFCDASPQRKTANYDVKSNHIWLWYTNGWEGVDMLPLNKISPTSFQIKFGGQSMVECSKKDAPPAPVNGLSANLSGSSISLIWVDNSTDETGFKIQYKTTSTGDWINASVASVNATSYLFDGLPTGTYWFRVIATNNYGDSMSSSEVQRTIQ